VRVGSASEEIVFSGIALPPLELDNAELAEFKIKIGASKNRAIDAPASP
jgi:hypothetical protein